MKFDKEKFSEILVKIKDSYGSINQMAEKANITTAYLSKLIRLMYDNAPSPEILEKIANNSNGIVTYDELMYICGYFSSDTILDEFYEKSFKELLPQLLEHNVSIQNALELHDILNSSEDISDIDFETKLEQILSELSETDFKAVYNLVVKFIKKQDDFILYFKNFLNTLIVEKEQKISIKNKEKKQKLETKYFMTPVYRSHFSRHTKLGRRMYRRKNTY